jgi:hypothetical protein
MKRAKSQHYWVTAEQLSIIETVVCGTKSKPQQAPEIFTIILENIRTKQLLKSDASE